MVHRLRDTVASRPARDTANTAMTGAARNVRHRVTGSTSLAAFLRLFGRAGWGSGWVLGWVAGWVAVVACPAVAADIHAIEASFHDQELDILVTLDNPATLDPEWAFQLFINADGDDYTGIARGFDVLVRGVEPAAPDAYYLRDTLGGGGPGGWGDVLAVVTADMTDPYRLALTVPLHSETGLLPDTLRYAFESYLRDEIQASWHCQAAQASLASADPGADGPPDCDDGTAHVPWCYGCTALYPPSTEDSGAFDDPLLDHGDDTPAIADGNDAGDSDPTATQPAAPDDDVPPALVDSDDSAAAPDHSATGGSARLAPSRGLCGAGTGMIVPVALAPLLTLRRRRRQPVHKRMI